MDTAAANVADGNATDVGHCHAVGNGDEDQLATEHGDSHTNCDNNAAGFPDAYADEYTAAAGSNFDHGSVLPGRRAIENAYSDRD